MTDFASHRSHENLGTLQNRKPMTFRLIQKKNNVNWPANWCARKLIQTWLQSWWQSDMDSIALETKMLPETPPHPFLYQHLDNSWCPVSLKKLFAQMYSKKPDWNVDFDLEKKTCTWDRKSTSKDFIYENRLSKEAKKPTASKRL